MLRAKGDLAWVVSVKDDEVWGLKIRSRNLAVSLISLHQSLWKLATPVTREQIASWGPNQFLQTERKKIVK